MAPFSMGGAPAIAMDRRLNRRRFLRSPKAVAALCLLPAALTACGRGGSADLPAACELPDGPASVRAALRSAPGQVRLDGTPLSRCLVRESAPADVQAVGAAYVQVATGLARAARRAPHSREATELGYLVGAVHRGASRTAGIHYELERRIELELNGVDASTAEYMRGERAGEASG
jgi:hypothetical protein